MLHSLFIFWQEIRDPYFIYMKLYSFFLVYTRSYTSDIFMTLVSVCSVLDRRWPYLRVYAIRCVRKEIASHTCAPAVRETRQISKAVVAVKDSIVKKKLEQPSRTLRKFSWTIIIKKRPRSRKIMIDTCRAALIFRREKTLLVLWLFRRCLKKLPLFSNLRSPSGALLLTRERSRWLLLESLILERLFYGRLRIPSRLRNASLNRAIFKREKKVIPSSKREFHNDVTVLSPSREGKKGKVDYYFMKIHSRIASACRIIIAMIAGKELYGFTSFDDVSWKKFLEAPLLLFQFIIDAWHEILLSAYKWLRPYAYSCFPWRRGATDAAK